MKARTVVKQLGGPAKVARYLDISTAAVSKWRRIPVERCADIAALSGGRYTPQQLRPDFPWPAAAA